MNRKIGSLPLIIGIVSIVSQTTFAQAASSSQLIDRLEASVNSSLILLSDISHFKKTLKLRTQLDPIFANSSVAAKGDKAENSDIIEFLINEKMISQVFPVTDAEVEQDINTIQSNNHIDRPTLKKALEEQGFTFDDYFELIRISASKRNLIDRDIRTKVAISEDDVKNYYYSHLPSTPTSTDRSYHLQLIYISPKTYKTVAAAKDAAQKALQSIRSGESFEEVAKRVSDDSSSSSGGDLGTVTEDQISSLMREQLKKLQIGKVSDVFGKPEKGFYILKLLDIKTNDSNRFEKLKDEIKSQLITSEYQHQISLWVERQRQNSFIHRHGETSLSGYIEK